MENIIYNELRSRGYNVDVGLVELGGKDENGKFVRKQLEVDFVVNRPPYRVYIQSAFHMPTPEKEQQERRPLLSINDHFFVRLSLLVMTFIARRTNLER